MAGTFLELAPRDFATGQTEHASRLLQHAERAAEVVKGMMERCPESAEPALRRKLEALNRLISEMQKAS